MKVEERIKKLKLLKCQVSNSAKHEKSYIKLSDICYIQRECLIDYSGGLTVKDNVGIGLRTLIYTHKHQFKNKNWKKMDVIVNELIIEENAFIGANCIISNVNRIGNNSVLGAGSVLTKDIPDNEIWAGNPAKKIGNVI